MKVNWTSLLHPLATLLIGIAPSIPNPLVQTLLYSIGAVLGGSTLITRAAVKATE